MLIIGDHPKTKDPLIEEDTLMEVEDPLIEEDTLVEDSWWRWWVTWRKIPWWRTPDGEGGPLRSPRGQVQPGPQGPPGPARPIIVQLLRSPWTPQH